MKLNLFIFNRFSKYTQSLLLVLLLLIAHLASSQVKYVTPSGAGTKDGTSWANAHDEAQLRVVLATATSGSQVWIAAGTYHPTTTFPSIREMYFKIHSGVSVYGGFSGNETTLNQRNFKTNTTIFSGDINLTNTVNDNSLHVVVFEDVTEMTLLDGITVRDGRADVPITPKTIVGGGIYIKGGQTNVKVLNCTITDNYATVGGGIYVEGNAAPIIQRCIIKNNNAINGGGIATLAESEFTINALFSQTFFINNNSTGNFSCGAALNEAQNTGINTTSYTNCVFAENNLANFEVSGIQGTNTNGTCTIHVTNCTFFNNGQNIQGDNVRGKAINCPFQIGGTITNSIFWNNGNKNISDFVGQPIMNVANNTIHYGFAQSTNTKTNNPEFFNESSIAGLDGIFGTLDDGLNIWCYSPAKNAGILNGAPTTDIIGTARPQDVGIDLGAYESLAPVMSISIIVSKKNVCANSMIAFTATAVNEGTTPLYQWKKNGINVGTNSKYFYDNAWTDNDSVSCEIASSHPCLLINSAKSNTIKVRISQRIYVNANATGANNGTSWADAYTNLNEAFFQILPCTPEIWVAKGVYKPSQNKNNNSSGPADRTNTFKLPNTKVYGGFSGNETNLSERDVFGNQTILSGDLDNNDSNLDGNYINENISDIQGSNAYNVVIIDGSPVPMALDGFVITGGNANVVSQSGNSAFTSNKGGGIIAIDVSMNLKIANCLISGNSAYLNGGGIMIDSSALFLENTIIINNYSFNGGGMAADYSFMQLKNVLFLKNKAVIGGALSNMTNFGGNAIHCVFFQNQANPNTGGYYQSGGTNSHVFFIRNSILWENAGLSIHNSSPTNALSIMYSDIEGLPPTTGNLWVIPGFQNPYDFDGPDDKWGTSDDGLKLACSSTLIDMAGSSNVLTDIIGTTRPYNSAPDIGAYEYIPTTPSVSITASNALCETSFVTLTTTVKDAFGLFTQYQWIKNGINEGNAPDYQGHFFDGDNVYCVITTSNACTAALTASSNHITLKGYSFPVIYVDSAAPANNGGNYWGNAINNLQSAIDLANSCANPPQIWVKKGTYYPSTYAYGAGSSNRDFTFTLKDNLAIYGGFNGFENNILQRNIEANPTILSGDIGVKGNNSDNCYHVILSSGNNNTAILDGFIIKDGNANGSGSIDVSGKPVYKYGGGGIFTTYSAAQFNNCLVRQNYAYTHGGGIYFDFGSPTLTNTVVTDNIASTGNGGGLFAYSSAHITTNCVFDYNRAGTYGGGLYQLYSNSVIKNSTFYNNTATRDGGGIYHENSAATIINSIIWGNNGGGTKGIKGVYYGPFVSYSNVEGGFSGTGNINSNPLFFNAIDPDGQDNMWKTQDDGLRLNCGSPAINTGTNTNAPDKDIIKTSRPLFSIVDMGAYEGLLFTAQPSITGNTTIDPGQNLILLADGGPNSLIKWYNSATGSTPISTNNPLTTSPANSTTYYVTSTLNNCESSKKSIPVVVTLCFNNPIPPNYAANANATLKSRNVITATNTVGTNATVNYQAVNSITLSPGFKTSSGTVFKATIQGCN